MLMRLICSHPNVRCPQVLQVITTDPDVPITELVGKFEKLIQRSAPFLASSKTAAANERSLQKLRTYLSSVVARSQSTYELEASEERVSFVVRDDRRQQLKTLHARLKVAGDGKQLAEKTLGSLFKQCGLPANFFWNDDKSLQIQEPVGNAAGI